MALIVLGLLWLLHLVSAIQSSNSDPYKRWEMANRVISFEVPQGYELTSALYSYHPRFFVLTQKESLQKIRVMRKPWWFKDRTPEEFESRFFHPGQWIRKPGLGYRSILVEQTGEVSKDDFKVPYVVGILASDQPDVEHAFIACLYQSSTDQSYTLFSSAPAEVFNITEVLDFTEQLAGKLR